MPKVLTQAQIDQFHEQGFVSPIRVMSDAEALGCRSRLERFERETGGSLGGHLRDKTHLLFTGMGREEFWAQNRDRRRSRPYGGTLSGLGPPESDQSLKVGSA